MKKFILLGVVVAGLAIVGTSQTAKADHFRGGGFGYGSSCGYGGYGYGRPYGYSNFGYSSFGNPGYGYGYGYQPGFSIVIGRGGYGGFGGYRGGYGGGWGGGHHHHHGGHGHGGHRH
jgi:hypothetical protein